MDTNGVAGLEGRDIGAHRLCEQAVNDLRIRHGVPFGNSN
jgi:hypothetical protein